jgi:hypothetical protein
MLVALDGLRVPDLRLIGVFIELPPRPSLSQEIPALVELDPDLLMALVVVGRAVGYPVELTLLVDEMLDVTQDAQIVHDASSLLL